jgi:hypothetical protein
LIKNVTLNDMTQAPEILKSMMASIDGDVAKIAEVHAQISDLAEKMGASKRAMKTVTKIYHAMCLQGERAAENLEGKSSSLARSRASSIT